MAGSRFPYRQSNSDDLERELKSFQREKERVRSIVGAVGGVPAPCMWLAGAVFAGIIAVVAISAIFSGPEIRPWMVELTMLVLSAKIIYLMHYLMRVSHFKFWMLSSLEYRTTEITKQVREVKRETKRKRAGKSRVRPETAFARESD